MLFFKALEVIVSRKSLIRSVRIDQFQTGKFSCMNCTCCPPILLTFGRCFCFDIQRTATFQWIFSNSLRFSCYFPCWHIEAQSWFILPYHTLPYLTNILFFVVQEVNRESQTLMRAALEEVYSAYSLFVWHAIGLYSFWNMDCHEQWRGGYVNHYKLKGD